MTDRPTPAEPKPASAEIVQPAANALAGLAHGRVVEYVDRMGYPRAALVAFVHTQEGYVEGGAVNLTVLDRDGSTYGETEVPFEKRTLPGGPRIHYWRWPKKV
jgi:hypothetical protein